MIFDLFRLGFTLLPHDATPKEDITIFVNNSDERSEECLVIRALYGQGFPVRSE
jgi:hypothetical protein